MRRRSARGRGWRGGRRRRGPRGPPRARPPRCRAARTAAAAAAARPATARCTSRCWSPWSAGIPCEASALGSVGVLLGWAATHFMRRSCRSACWPGACVWARWTAAAALGVELETISLLMNAFALLCGPDSQEHNMSCQNLASALQPCADRSCCACAADNRQIHVLLAWRMLCHWQPLARAMGMHCSAFLGSFAVSAWHCRHLGALVAAGLTAKRVTDRSAWRTSDLMLQGHVSCNSAG